MASRSEDTNGIRLVGCSVDHPRNKGLKSVVSKGTAFFFGAGRSIQRVAQRKRREKPHKCGHYGRLHHGFSEYLRRFVRKSFRATDILIRRNDQRNDAHRA